MSKYSVRQVSPQDKPRPWDVHPIWRGLGCFMIILVPIVSYAGAVLVIENELLTQLGVPLSFDLIKPIPIVFSSPLPEFLPFSVNMQVEHLYGNLAVGMILMMLGFGLLMVFYAIIFRMMGPSRLGPLDAKPIRRSPKR